jgi:hypothetical protein
MAFLRQPRAERMQAVQDAAMRHATYILIQVICECKDGCSR